MAEVNYQKEKVEVKDGEHIKDACETLGVSIGCNEGFCGVCAIEVIEGAENLNEANEREKAFGFAENKRLCCQAKILQGKIKIEF